jgi:hypothetical protein
MKTTIINEGMKVDTHIIPVKYLEKYFFTDKEFIFANIAPRHMAVFI